MRFCALLLAAAVAGVASAYDNGVARLPPMGWNTWCTDGVCAADICTQDELISVTDSIIAQGLDKLGYQYILMDDCWSANTRDANGNLQPNATQFPQGFPYLVDYVHSKGLKIGLYTCIGELTCRFNRPGSFQHYKEDAETIAGWGFDYIKTDNCFKPDGYTEQQLYTNFSHWINATGRPILFALCEWGLEDVELWGGKVAQQFRIHGDHEPNWGSTSGIIEAVAGLNIGAYNQAYNHWDPDFLETLYPGTPYHESRTEYTFWSLWSAPLIVATDVRNMSAEMASLIANPEVIAIDQDPLLVGGDRIAVNGNSQIWMKNLFNGDKAVVLYNNGTGNVTVGVTWSLLGWESSAKVAVRDLWARQDLGVFSNGYNATVDTHSVFYFRATPQ